MLLSFSIAVAQTTPRQPAPLPIPTQDEVLALTPFEVKADGDDSYDATNTNSITGTNTSLNKTPLDARIYNRHLMDELNIVDMSIMLGQIGGMGVPMISGDTDAATGLLAGDRLDYKSITMRGLPSSNPRRDGFLRSDTSLMDSFDTERLEAISGSNSLLFGSGGAGGVLTVDSKRAKLGRQSLVTTATIDNFGSKRGTIDLNAGTKIFAVRVDAVKANNYYAKPVKAQYNEGLQVAVSFQPIKRVNIFAEWRHYERDQVISASGTVRADTNLVLAPAILDANGKTLVAARKIDGSTTLRLLAYQTGRDFLAGSGIDIDSADSVVGFYSHDYYVNRSKAVTAEVNVLKNLDVQLRVGDDYRVNKTLRPQNSTVYSPSSPLNQFVGPDGTKQWSLNTWPSQTNAAASGDFGQGSRGYRATAVYRLDTDKWGHHTFSLFKQDTWSTTLSDPKAFFRSDQNGNIIQDLSKITDANSGRTPIGTAPNNNLWQPIFPSRTIFGKDWPLGTVLNPFDGNYYSWAPFSIRGAVPATAGNPLGLSGPVSATTGRSTGGYSNDRTIERSVGFSMFSSFWRDRVDVMLGRRQETASAYRDVTAESSGPVDYDGTTAGFVTDTGIDGLRLSADYATNGLIAFGTARDIYDQPLPVGKGITRDVGLKFSLWNHKVSGNLTYYSTKALNFTADSGNDSNPIGINGRRGGGTYVYSKTSNGISLNLSTRPTKNWEVRFNVTTQGGRELSDVILPIFYNDEFNTMVFGGETVVAIKDSTGGFSPLLVPSNPAVTGSPLVPLSLAMLKNPASPNAAILDPETGYITNVSALRLNTPGVGTGRVGLPISANQLGFVSPSGDTITVRKAGAVTVGYPEQNFNIINRYEFRGGRLKGLTLGVSATWQRKYRWLSYTDVFDGGAVKVFYVPDRYTLDPYAIYRFKFAKKYPVAVQVNVTNLFSRQDLYLQPTKADGSVGRLNYNQSPRQISMTTTVSF